jgi:hypothetical protein
MGHSTVPRAGVRPAPCTASSPATLSASGRFRFFHRTGSKAPGTPLLCSVPAGADNTDGDRDKRRKLAGAFQLPTRGRLTLESSAQEKKEAARISGWNTWSHIAAEMRRRANGIDARGAGTVDRQPGENTVGRTVAEKGEARRVPHFADIEDCLDDADKSLTGVLRDTLPGVDNSQ